MIWIGLTGGIASGKSTVAEELKKMGFVVIDADQVAREVVQPGRRAYKHIISEFGEEIIDADSQIDRKKLGKIVFSDPVKRRLLEEIVHPEVQSSVALKREQLASEGVKAAFYVVPLLFEKNLQKNFDHTILVGCRREQQIERLKKRNGYSDSEIESRLNSQWSNEEKSKLADLYVSNEGTIDELKKSVAELFNTKPMSGLL